MIFFDKKSDFKDKEHFLSFYVSLNSGKRNYNQLVKEAEEAWEKMK